MCREGLNLHVKCWNSTTSYYFLLARLIDQYCIAGCCLSSSVTLPAVGPAGRRARGGRAADTVRRASRVTSRTLGRHLVLKCSFCLTLCKFMNVLVWMRQPVRCVGWLHWGKRHDGNDPCRRSKTSQKLQVHDRICPTGNGN